MSMQEKNIDIQYAITAEGLPSEQEICQWVGVALQGRQEQAELVVRIVDEAEITALNRSYRGKVGATNVLSFPYEPMPEVDTRLLGDIVICAPVVAEEAVAQGKLLDAHWAHIVIHGVLHLLGYDHSRDSEAREMERLETEQLASLGYTNPY
jgi:probable rRNA maturation factor